MTDPESRIEALQKAFCAEHAAEYIPARSELKSGLALSTRGVKPINGLRHPLERDTTGWYIWCGEHYSDAPDFFAPVHTCHIYDDYPELVNILGLPPGYHFLIAGNYLDVWYDASLLKT